ncbi:hypothetical protein BX600DRAFT_469996 [Xylariales sp. PMI_506]|nr:hypothetical protein BX600DRAFT_469996 [Xylariales sp. PMI_506]
MIKELGITYLERGKAHLNKHLFVCHSFVQNLLRSVSHPSISKMAETFYCRSCSSLCKRLARLAGVQSIEALDDIKQKQPEPRGGSNITIQYKDINERYHQEGLQDCLRSFCRMLMDEKINLPQLEICEVEIAPLQPVNVLRIFAGTINAQFIYLVLSLWKSKTFEYLADKRGLNIREIGAQAAENNTIRGPIFWLGTDGPNICCNQETIRQLQTTARDAKSSVAESTQTVTYKLKPEGSHFEMRSFIGLLQIYGDYVSQTTTGAGGLNIRSEACNVDIHCSRQMLEVNVHSGCIQMSGSGMGKIHCQGTGCTQIVSCQRKSLFWRDEL